eukprot:jgi/Psemu1/32380/gm1.32380_g
MNTQFLLCIQYKRTFDIAEDHDSHKLPKERWNKMITGRESDHSREGFKMAIQVFMNVITPDPDAKGTLIAAFEHQHMAKPVGCSEQVHFSRINTVLGHIDMLPGGDGNDLTEQEQRKKDVLQEDI